MAGPLDLRGRAVITDGATGPLNAIKGRIDGIAASTGKLAQAQNLLASGSRGLTRATQAVVGATAAGYGITNVLRKAEEFNKNVFGVGTAVLSENVRKVVDSSTGLESVVYDIDKVRAAMQRFEKAALDISKETGQTPSRISGIGEVLAKAGFDEEKLRAATKAIAVVSATDMETPVQKIGEFASVLDTIYKPRQGEQWAQFFERQMDIVRIAAGETRLSVGSMMEGLRPFSALYSLMGNNEYSAAKLLMGGVKEGGEATEVGHTLKSNAVRFMRMTQEGQNTFSALGLRRGDYTDLSAMDPTRAAGNLSRAFRTANISGKFRKQIEGDLQKAMEGGYADDPKFIDKLMGRVAKRGGVDMKDEVSRERFEEKFVNALFASGMKFDAEKLFKNLIDKGATPAQLSAIFEARRIGTNIQILEGLKKWGDEFAAKLSMASGAGIGATQAVFDESNYGRLQRFNSMIEQFMIKLANSAGFETFLNGITVMFDKLGQLPKPLIDIGTYAAVAAVALGPLALGIAAVGAVLGPLRWLVGLGAGAGIAAGAAGIGSRIMGAGAGFAAAGGGMAMLRGTMALGRLGLRFLPGIGLVAMGGGAVYGGYQAWKRGEDGWGVAKGAALGSIGIGGADAAGTPRSPLAGPSLDQPWNTESSTGAAGGAADGIRSAADRMRQSLDDGAGGVRDAGTTLAGAIREAAAMIRSAASEAASSAGRVRLDTGANMQGAMP